MSRIGGTDDVPDFSGIRPIMTPDDIAAMDQAIEEFNRKRADFNAAVDNAEKAVEVTLAWVGVGEKVVTLASAIVQKQLQNQPTAGESATRLNSLQGKLTELASLHTTLKGLLPGILS